jgi:hypothetical protein
MIGRIKMKKQIIRIDSCDCCEQKVGCRLRCVLGIVQGGCALMSDGSLEQFGFAGWTPYNKFKNVRLNERIVEVVE